MMAEFKILEGRDINTYTSFHDIPPRYTNVIETHFDLLEPEDGDDHTVYQHAVMAEYHDKLMGLLEIERTGRWWPSAFSKLTDLTLYNNDDDMSTAILQLIDTVDLNRGSYIQGGYYAGSV
jgi:hypothetical protein